MEKVTLDIGFIYNLRPERIVLIALLILLGLLILAPIKINNTLDTSSVLYIIFSLFFFLLGTKLVRNKRIKSQIEIKVDRSKINRIYKSTFYLGLVGVLFRYYDLFAYRGVSMASSTIDNMDLMADAGGNIFSIIASLLIFNAYIPPMIDIICKKLHSLKWKVLSSVTFFALMINGLISGSRFAIIIPVGYYLLLLLCAGKLRLNLSFRNVVSWLVIFISMIYVVGALFLRRVSDQNITAFMTIASATGGYSDKVPATESFQRFLMNSEDKWYYVYLFAYSNITQYGTHAIFEFPIVKKYIDQQGDYFYGKATFAVITKFIHKIIGSSYNIQEDINDHNARIGIWSTFFFLWYLDFGWLGIFCMFFLGYFAKKVWSHVYYQHNILYLPLLCIFSIILLLIFQLNYISGSGTYALTTFTLLTVCFKSPFSTVLIDKKLSNL